MARRETEAEKLARVQAILAGLDHLYPRAHCELDFGSPWQLLCATILSAQCTDERVNQVTPVLFRRWPDPRALGGASQADVEEVIRSTGFFRNKARALGEMSRALVEKHGGQVPHTMEEMLELHGVARKTANVVLGSAYGLTTGIVVDTHVIRLSDRLALTLESEPAKIERDLMALIPRDRWVRFSHQLIWHGRRVCTARAPRCPECALLPYCPAGAIFTAGPGTSAGAGAGTKPARVSARAKPTRQAKARPKR